MTRNGRKTYRDRYSTSPSEYLKEYGAGPETSHDRYGPNDGPEWKEFELGVLRRYGRRSYDGSRLVSQDYANLDGRSGKGYGAFAKNNLYPLNVRFAYGFLTLVYVLSVLVFYSAPYVYFGRSVELGSFYGALLAWNSFKPLLIYAVVFSITQHRLSMLPTLVLGGFACFVLIGTFVLQLVALNDVFSKCNTGFHPDHPCNDPLYCCVYYDRVPSCVGKGPCSNYNASGWNVTTAEFTESDLRTNENYKLMIYILLVLFVLEILFVRYFVDVLYVVNSDGGYDSLFLDTTKNYEYEKRLPHRGERRLLGEGTKSAWAPDATGEETQTRFAYADLGSKEAPNPISGEDSNAEFKKDVEEKSPFKKMKNRLSCDRLPKSDCCNRSWSRFKKVASWCFERTLGFVDVAIDHVVEGFNNIFVFKSREARYDRYSGKYQPKSQRQAQTHNAFERGGDGYTSKKKKKHGSMSDIRVMKK